MNAGESGRQRRAQLQPREPGGGRGLARRRQRSTSTPTTARASRRRRSPSSPTARWARVSTSALQPRVSNSVEIGLKALFGAQQRVNLAAFNIETTDEIVIDTATGRPHDVQERGETRRRGVEAAWEGSLGAGFAGYASYTYLSAKFASDATTGVPPLLVPAGARLPGVPRATPTASSRGRIPRRAGLDRGLEVQYAGKMYVNDRNTDAAPAYTIGNAARSASSSAAGSWLLREFARLNNFANRNYVGSVIVGDTNGRYFEPAATRNFLVGLSANASF